MRSWSLTALTILAAFALGLSLGGQLPHDTAAASGNGGLTWKSDGTTLVLTNTSATHGYLVRGNFWGGSSATPPPSYVKGTLEVPVHDVDKLYVYRLEAAAACDSYSCRSCDEAPTLCPMPPRPMPLGETDVQTGVDTFHP